jgi:HEAT repeat protein
VAVVSHVSIAIALDSPEAEERRQATVLLAQLSADLAVPLLIRSLGDHDWRVRKEATIAARAFVDEQSVIAALVEVLAAGDNVGLRNAAAEVLAGAGRLATAALARAFPSLDADGRKLAVETLGRARDAEGLAVLENGLGDADPNVRATSIEAVAGLGSVAPERVQSILSAHLTDTDPLVRLTALDGLTALGVVVPWNDLEPFLDDPALRPTALAAAALTSSPEAARALVAGLAAARGTAFEKAAQALGRLIPGPLVGTIATALKAAGPELRRRLLDTVYEGPDSGADERRGVALQLAALAESEGVVAAALMALDEEGLAVAAQRALETLDEGVLPELIAHLTAPASDLAACSESRGVLVDVIAKIARRSPSRDALLALRAAAASPDDRDVAVRAVYALSALGDEGDFALAAQLVGSPSHSIAIAAEGLLGALVGRFPVAARSFADQMTADPERLTQTAIVLGALGAASAYREDDGRALSNVATAGEPRARRAAVQAISDLRATAGVTFSGATDLLSVALTDEEHDVQMAAARALGRLCSAKDPLRVAEVIELVDRLGTADLLAATVRAIGEGLSTQNEGREPGLLLDELVAAVGTLVHDSRRQVVIAAVEALGRAERAGCAAATASLTGALEHTDADVAKAALLKLAAAKPEGATAVRRGLDNPSPAVRALAIELLADTDSDELREDFALRVLREPDRMVRDSLLRALGRPSLAPSEMRSDTSERSAAAPTLRRLSPMPGQKSGST